MFEDVKWGISYSPSWDRTGMPESGYSKKDAALKEFFDAIDDGIDYVALYYNNGTRWEKREVYKNGMPKPKRPNDPTILTIPDGTKIIDKVKLKTKVVELYIPSSVEEIAPAALYGAYNLKKVVFADNSNLKKIGNQAFAYCKDLTSINLPSSLEEIEYSAFDNCRSLKFIELPNNIKKLGSSIFNITSIKSIVVPPYAELDSTFNECKNIESVILSEGLETIGPYTFYSCSNLKSVKLPNSLKNIDNSAFAFCSKLISINLPENISYIGPRAFDCTPIESANLSKNLIDIEEKAFSGTKLKNIIIPNNIKKIKTKTFSYCSLESITIPSSVEYIDEWAFDSCKNLKTVNILGNTTKISSRAFDNCPNASIIYHGSKQDLKHNIFFPEWDDEHLIKLPQNIVYKAEDQNLESILAESFKKTIKNLQREGLFENVKSFDLNFTGRGINIKLNESRPGNRNVSFKKRSNLKENETNEVTYAQDFLGEDIDISELKEAAAEAGISLEIYEGTGNLGMDEIYVTASSEEALKEFLYDWWLIENDDDFEAGLLD